MKKIFLLAAVALVLGSVSCKKNQEPTPDKPVHVTAVMVDPSVATIDRYSTVQLTPTVIPANATNKSVSWNTDAPNVASVNKDGKVTGLEPGTAVITVRTADGGFTTKCTITVK